MTSYGPIRRSAAETDSRARSSASTSVIGRTTSHPLIRLQRQLGNEAVSRLVAQRQEAEGLEGEEEELMALHDPASVQREEAEGLEGEEEELMALHDPASVQREEAEGLEGEEEELMALHDPASVQREEAEGLEGEEEELMALHDPASVQREEAEGLEGEEEELMALHDPASVQREETELGDDGRGVQRDAATAQVGLEGGPVGSDIESRIDSQRGAGSALDASFQSKMEGSLGTPLDSVRVHRGAESDALNRTISAKAFTTGSDIFLRNDVSPNDQSTMAHEVAHVVQQRTMDTAGSSSMSVGAADSSYEQEADQFAAAALSGSGPQEHEEA